MKLRKNRKDFWQLYRKRSEAGEPRIKRKLEEDSGPYSQEEAAVEKSMEQLAEGLLTEPLEFRSLLQEARVTRDNGELVDISVILPTKVVAVVEEEEKNMARFDMNEFEAVIREEGGLSSGKLEWKEVAWESGRSCGRSADDNKRARLLFNEFATVTVTHTTFYTSIVPAANTVTFSVKNLACTRNGFQFAVPLCTASGG